MQSRLGPNEAGPYGSLQLLAEVGKWLQKEDIVPERADRHLFKMAPYLVVATVLLIYAAVPFGPDAWFTNLDVGIFYVLAVGSVSVIGILVAGWSSANKYSLIGALRAAGQLIAYELPMVLAVVGVVIQAGTMNLQGIVAAQADGEIFGFGRRSSRRRPSTCPSPSPRSSPATSPSTPACGSSCSSSASSPRRPPSAPSPPRCSSAAGTCRGSA
jgi:NADH-quinone oxidoreductase subunit H